MVYGVIAQIARPILVKAARQLYRAVNLQDQVLKKSLFTAKLSKPYRQGIRHGAAGGAIVGSVIETLKNDFADDTANGPIQPRKNVKYKTRKSYQTRNRFQYRSRRRNEKYCRPYKYS